MKGFDNRVFLRISGAHAGILILMLIIPWFKGCRRPKPKEIIVFMDIAGAMPAPAPVPAPAPEPEPAPKPKPVPVPKPSVTNTPPRPKPPPTNAPAKPKPPPPKPEPKVETKPAPKPAPKETEAERLAKIRQDTPARRPVQAPAPSAQPIDLSGLKAALSSAGLPGTGTGSGSGVYSPFAGYYDTVKQRMYGVWHQPAGAPIGLTATAVIRVERDGAVSSKVLTRRSGHPAFDQSVQNALNATARLPAPPADLPDRNISIEFMLSN